MPVYDLTVPISPSMAQWPGDPPVAVSRAKSLGVDGYNLSHISLGSHTGTHIDAPHHYIENGATVDRISLDILMGKAYVFEVRPHEGVMIEPADLVSLGIPRDASRVLLKTENSALWEPGPQIFEQRFVYLGRKAARWLVERGVKLIGIDYMSVDQFLSVDSPAHHEFLRAGVVIVESLNLSRVEPGVYHLVVLPLKISGGDGAPARAVLLR